MSFRCAAASVDRDEPAAGSASTVRAFLLVENAGPWGVDALRDARLPDEVKDGLRSRAARAGVRVLLIRRHRGTPVTAGLRVFAAWADPHAPWLETTTVAAPEVLVDLDLEALGRGASPGLTPTLDPVFCVCTHGRHDACCAELGRPTASALSAAHPDQTWEVSHVGGDRFAANVLVLPDGLYYGRVPAADAGELGTRHLAGQLSLDRLRGRSGFGFAVQVAEVGLRRELGETRTGAVRLVSSSRSGADTTVVLGVDGTTYAVVVRSTPGTEEHRLTCRATRPNLAPAYEVVSVRRA
ncbi:MAG: sucrase ferredoxin [Nocardioidaceae bacterium]